MTTSQRWLRGAFHELTPDECRSLLADRLLRPADPSAADDEPQLAERLDCAVHGGRDGSLVGDVPLEGR